MSCPTSYFGSLSERFAGECRIQIGDLFHGPRNVFPSSIYSDPTTVDTRVKSRRNCKHTITFMSEISLGICVVYKKSHNFRKKNYKKARLPECVAVKWRVFNVHHLALENIRKTGKSDSQRSLAIGTGRWVGVWPLNGKSVEIFQRFFRKIYVLGSLSRTDVGKYCSVRLREVSI